MDSIAEVGGVTTLVKDSTFELLFERVREFKCWSPVVKTFCEVLKKKGEALSVTMPSSIKGMGAH